MKLVFAFSTALLFIITVSVFYMTSILAPANFPVSTIYSVKSGTGLNSLARDLESEDIIASPFWFKVFSVLSGGTKGVKSGDYALNKVENNIKFAYRLSKGDFRLVPVRLTIPEGLNSTEISKLVHEKFPNLNTANFITEAKLNEGYLFPETYLFLPNVTSPDIIKKMKDTFVEKVGTTTPDIIKMASILELEARTTETRKIVAGILWDRIELGMPLQVDSSFKYINGKTTATLSLQDLKLDSPYNSYVYKGLPPTPISNPGLDSINAALNPTKTDYLYFLTGNDGKMYYAQTYAKHLQNKDRYLTI